VDAEGRCGELRLWAEIPVDLFIIFKDKNEKKSPAHRDVQPPHRILPSQLVNSCGQAHGQPAECRDPHAPIERGSTTTATYGVFFQKTGKTNGHIKPQRQCSISTLVLRLDGEVRCR
jgi:hypothetical protein